MMEQPDSAPRPPNNLRQPDDIVAPDGSIYMSAPQPDVERIFRLYATGFQSNAEGMRATIELTAMAEDWFDTNVDGGWPLPRIDRRPLSASTEQEKWVGRKEYEEEDDSI